MSHKVDYPLNKTQALNLLRQHEILPTAQRIEIACLLFARKQHLSAEQIWISVNRSSETVSKATVYNTLGLFVRKGLIQQVLIAPERVFYDSNLEPHHHAYNVDTGELSDVDAECISIQGSPPLAGNMLMDRIDLIFRVKNHSA